MIKICKTLACPCCSSTEVECDFIFKKEKVEKINDELGEGIKENYAATYECYCSKCSNKYFVDYGKGYYTVYKDSKSVTCIGDVKILAKFMSEYERNFEIFVALNLKNTKVCEDIYYILLEDDKYPVFITKEQADEFIININRAKAFVKNTWMSRYR